MRDLQGTIDEEYRKSPEEAMRLYDGKTIKEAFPHVLKSQLESRLNMLEAGDCRRRRKTPSFRRSHLAKPEARRQTIRRELLKRCNVLFFERKEASEKPWTIDLWIYDLRTNQHFTLKTNPLANKDLDDFKACYGEKTAGCKPALHTRQETERFKKFTYAEIVARDKANLDILWLKDDSLEDSDNLPAPAVLAAEIVESLEAALEEFRAVEEALATVEET